MSFYERLLKAERRYALSPDDVELMNVVHHLRTNMALLVNEMQIAELKARRVTDVGRGDEEDREEQSE